MRRSHIGRYFFELNKLYQSISIEMIQNEGFPEFRQSHLKILSQLDIHNGVEMIVLLERAGVLKQELSRTLSACEKLGYITRTASLDDGRGKFVSFTRKGLKLMEVAAGTAKQTETYLSNKIGHRKFHELKSLLKELTEVCSVLKVDP